MVSMLEYQYETWGIFINSNHLGLVIGVLCSQKWDWMEGRDVELTILYVLEWRVWVFSSNWIKMYITRQYQSPNSARFHWMAVSVKWKSNGWFYIQFFLLLQLLIFHLI